jgi:hypothetical protein
VNTGFTTIAPRSSPPARSLRHLTRIRLINQCRRRQKRCPQTGKRCFTNSRHTAICRAVRWPRRRHERHDVFMIPVASLWSGDIAAGLVVPSSPAPSLEGSLTRSENAFFWHKKGPARAGLKHNLIAFSPQLMPSGGVTRRVADVGSAAGGGVCARVVLHCCDWIVPSGSTPAAYHLCLTGGNKPESQARSCAVVWLICCTFGSITWQQAHHKAGLERGRCFFSRCADDRHAPRYASGISRHRGIPLLCRGPLR